MPKPRKVRNERVQALSAGGNGQNDLYNKRKALEPPKSKKQIGYELSKGHNNTLMETMIKAGEFPRKKQRMESPQLGSDLDDCPNLYEEEYDL